jgi:hypothetical protein
VCLSGANATRQIKVLAQQLAGGVRCFFGSVQVMRHAKK